MKYFSWVLVIASIVFVFRQWFTASLLVATDLPLAHPELLSETGFFPYAWSTLRSGFYAPLLWPHFLLTVPATALHTFFNAPWSLIERLLFFYPFLLIGVFSSWYLVNKVSPQNAFTPLACLIYLLNSYILMIASGGQMQIALTYACVPFVLAQFLLLGESLLENKSSKNLWVHALINGIVFACVAMLDIRIAYITGVALFLYILVLLLTEKWDSKRLGRFLVFFCVIPGGVTVLLNAFWILPVGLSRQNPIEQLGAAYSTVEALKYFSFTRFEQSFALLHPYWPENIFGKVGFMKPAFLLFPVVAFSTLWLLNRCNKYEKRMILYFVLLALSGAFLAKGANPPFGEVNIWLFTHVPGFQSFRDASKFFLLVAVSYAVLIPITLQLLQQEVPKKIQLQSTIGITLIFVVGFIVIHHQAFTNQIQGTLQKSDVPHEYKKLESLLKADSEYSRILWVPVLQRYSYYSTNHPPFSAQDFFMLYDLDTLLGKLKEPDVLAQFQEASVKYVVVPMDTTGDIFVRDRKYDETLYKRTIETVGEIPLLKRLPEFTQLAVFVVPNPRGHFSLESDGSFVKSEMINPTHFRVNPDASLSGQTIVFTETFDKRWEVKSNGQNSRKYNKWNSFTFPGRDSSVDVIFKPQEWVRLGVLISCVSAIVLFSGIIILRRKKND